MNETPEKKSIRLSKLMSERGLCSRREADELIRKGWVKVDRSVVTELGFKTHTNAEIELDPRARKHLSGKVTILLNKPVGYVSQNPEPGYVPAVRLIQPQNQWKKGALQLQAGHLKGLAVAGRLDIDSKGLLIFTQDGALAKRLIGENSQIEKEYLVWVDRDLTEPHLRQLSELKSLDGEDLKPFKVQQLGPQKLRMVLRQGKKRQIRRMCQAVELQVTSLKRIRVGKIRLGSLPEGQWRFLEPQENF